MELKPYQQAVLSNLEGYMHLLQEEKGIATAFDRFWEEKLGPYNALDGTGMKPYQDSVPGAVHLCVKVPTAGGKTFIACNALHTIFSAYDATQPRAVVWLVPWGNLLEQTIRSLSDPKHPYRQRLNTLFNGRVAVYDKKDLLQGAGFNPTTAARQLSIFVLSFASLRARNKDDRKIYQENGQLAPFAGMGGVTAADVLEGTDETALINVIRALKPVVVVDESHNAESELSTEMLQSLSPSFILDLTATPGKKSNIIAFASALELKKEHMVKLPVIVYNHANKNEVITSALHLRDKLEALAKEEAAAGGRAIRPIVLFQAQPKTGEEATTFTKIKEQLLLLGIPEAQIKIKTAQIDELKGMDLMAPDCPVRYIITINALKEGWDCPFAYILASLADKSSETDVTQILGRVLRQPYVMRHQHYQLNLSYVLTASARFDATLGKVVEGLQAAGFSRNDYRSEDAATSPAVPEISGNALVPEAPTGVVERPLFPNQHEKIAASIEEDENVINAARISYAPPAEREVPTSAGSTPVQGIEALARATAQAFDAHIAQVAATTPVNNPVPEEMASKVKNYQMRPAVAAAAKALMLPRFYVKVPNANPLFGLAEWEPLNPELLLKDFKLSKESSDIDFERLRTELYAVDLEEVRAGDYTPKFLPVERPEMRDPLVEYILAKPEAARIADSTEMLTKLIGDMWPIPEGEIRKYVARVVSDMSAGQLGDFLSRKLTYSEALKKKIRSLAEAYAERRFLLALDARTIDVQADYQLPASIVPGRLGADISGSLYEREGEMNRFETQVIGAVAGLENVVFWHRNLGRGKGFAINGFKSNHYPDFILMTRSGTVVLLETKGEHLDNPDTQAKLRLGEKWAQKAGDQYRYFLVDETKKIPGAKSVEEIKDILSSL